MSRVGKLPIIIPNTVKVQISDSNVDISGPIGLLTIPFVGQVKVSVENSRILVMPLNVSSKARALWGLFRSLIANAVKGVSEGWVRRLEITGVGYRASCVDNMLFLNLGYSHEVIYAVPPAVEIKCEKPTLVVISGCDKQLVNQVAAEIRQFRKPEPYKGKGIKYDNEVVRRKEGKKK